MLTPCEAIWNFLKKKKKKEKVGEQVDWLVSDFFAPRFPWAFPFAK